MFLIEGILKALIKRVRVGCKKENYKRLLYVGYVNRMPAMVRHVWSCSEDRIFKKKEVNK